MTSDGQNILNVNEMCKIRTNTPLRFHLQETDPSFVPITKPLSNK